MHHAAGVCGDAGNCEVDVGVDATGVDAFVEGVDGVGGEAPVVVPHCF